MDKQKLHRPEVLSVRVMPGTKEKLDKLRRQYTKDLGTDVSKGQALEMVLTKALQLSGDG